MRISDWSSDVCSSDLPVPIDSSAVSAAKAGSDPLPESDQDTRGIVAAEVSGSRNRAPARAVQRIGGRRRLLEPQLRGPGRARRSGPVPRLPPAASRCEIGRAHVCTPVTNAHLVCRLLLETQNNLTIQTLNSTHYYTYDQ